MVTSRLNRCHFSKTDFIFVCTNHSIIYISHPWVFPKLTPQGHPSHSSLSYFSRVFFGLTCKVVSSILHLRVTFVPRSFYLSVGSSTESFRRTLILGRNLWCRSLYPSFIQERYGVTFKDVSQSGLQLERWFMGFFIQLTSSLFPKMRTSFLTDKTGSRSIPKVRPKLKVTVYWQFCLFYLLTNFSILARNWSVYDNFVRSQVVLELKLHRSNSFYNFPQTPFSLPSITPESSQSLHSLMFSTLPPSTKDTLGKRNNWLWTTTTRRWEGVSSPLWSG